jgi:hypothetical protein
MKPAAAYFMASPRQGFAAAHNSNFQNYILFERFQIELPLDAIGIILAPTGIDPVDAGQYPKSELPP